MLRDPRDSTRASALGAGEVTLLHEGPVMAIGVRDRDAIRAVGLGLSTADGHPTPSVAALLDQEFAVRAAGICAIRHPHVARGHERSCELNRDSSSVSIACQSRRCDGAKECKDQKDRTKYRFRFHHSLPK